MFPIKFYHFGEKWNGYKVSLSLLSSNKPLTTTSLALRRFSLFGGEVSSDFILFIYFEWVIFLILSWGVYVDPALCTFELNTLERFVALSPLLLSFLDLLALFVIKPIWVLLINPSEISMVAWFVWATYVFFVTMNWKQLSGFVD